MQAFPFREQFIIYILLLSVNFKLFVACFKQNEQYLYQYAKKLALL